MILGFLSFEEFFEFLIMKRREVQISKDFKLVCRVVRFGECVIFWFGVYGDFLWFRIWFY